MMIYWNFTSESILPQLSTGVMVCSYYLQYTFTIDRGSYIFRETVKIGCGISEEFLHELNWIWLFQHTIIAVILIHAAKKASIYLRKKEFI